MEYFASVFWIGLETTSLYLLHDAFLHRKIRPAFWWILLATQAIVLGLLSGCGIGQYIVTALSLISSFFLYRYLFDGLLLWRILILILGMMLTGIIDTGVLYGTSALLRIPLDVLVWRKIQYIAIVSVGKLLNVFLAWLTSYLRRRTKFQRVRKSWLLLILTFPIVSLAMLLVVFAGYQERGDLSAWAVLFSLALAIANCATLFLIQKIETQTRIEHEVILLNHQMAIQTDSIVALEKSYRAQRQATHEFQRHLQIIGDLLESEHTEKAYDYLCNLQEKQTTRIFRVNSKHAIIDAVLNQKYQIAKEQDIDIQFRVNNLEKVEVPNDMIVVILSNLLDNAIEACQRIQGERTVECAVICKEDLFLSISNTSDPVEIRNNQIATSKEPKEEHGFGLINVVRILEQLGAEFTFTYEDGYFHFVAEIPLAHKQTV